MTSTRPMPQWTKALRAGRFRGPARAGAANQSRPTRPAQPESRWEAKQSRAMRMRPRLALDRGDTRASDRAIDGRRAAARR
jgi:hypothetical protein